MQLKAFSRNFLNILLLLMPSVALGHSGDVPHSGFLHGFSHPFSGLDHVLAMIAVGLWAAQASNRNIWLLPLTFTVIMGLGGLLGIITLPVLFAEQGITLSLLVLGILLACRKLLPPSLSILLTGLFALSHGYAHGSEMPPDITLLTYATGFMSATLLLHLFGITLAWLFRRLAGVIWVRFSGIIIACYGGFLSFQ